MILEAFDYELPTQLIAQEPLQAREASRMLVLGRTSGDYEDRQFSELPELLRGDELIVVNNARVISARLFAQRLGVRAEPPGKATQRHFLQSKIEVLLVRQI